MPTYIINSLLCSPMYVKQRDTAPQLHATVTCLAILALKPGGSEIALHSDGSNLYKDHRCEMRVKFIVGSAFRKRRVIPSNSYHCCI